MYSIIQTNNNHETPTFHNGKQDLDGAGRPNNKNHRPLKLLVIFVDGGRPFTLLLLLK
jgi:hypothetical protein